MDRLKRNDTHPAVTMLCPHGYTGLSYYVYALCRSLSDAGTGVTLLTSDTWVPANVPAPFDIIKLYRYTNGPRSRARKGMAYLASTRRAYQALAHSSAPLFHMQITELPPVDAWLMRQARRMGKRVLFTPHDIVHTKRYPGGHAMLQQCFDAAHGIIVHNENNKRELCDRYTVDKTRVRIIPHGNYAWRMDVQESRDQACARLGLDKDKQWLLFFGDIRPSKGLETLCRAMPVLMREFPQARLLIAGRLSHGLKPAWLQRVVREAGCGAWTEKRLGFIPDDLIVSYYRAASAVVMPYHSISESGVLRFAHSAGAIPVCSDLPEFRETITDGYNGFLFKPGDETDCARALAQALEMRDNAAMLQAIKKTDRLYAWDRIANQTQQMYRELLSA